MFRPKQIVLALLTECAGGSTPTDSRRQQACHSPPSRGPRAPANRPSERSGGAAAPPAHPPSYLADGNRDESSNACQTGDPAPIEEVDMDLYPGCQDHQD